MKGEALPSLARISKASVSGTEVYLQSAGTVLVVGPNNSGKTVLLNELINSITNGVQEAHLIIREQPSLDLLGDTLSWLRKHRAVVGSGDNEAIQSDGQSIATRKAKRFDEQGRTSGVFGSLTPHIFKHLPTQSRLNSLNWPARRALPSTTAPNTAVERIAYDTTLRNSLVEAVRQTFDLDIVFDGLGQEVTIRVAPRSFAAPADPYDSTTHLPKQEAVDAYAALPDLNQQGDGVRAFVNVYLEALSSAYPVILIDEPEAFLHPATSYALGRRLALSESQVFVSTHSSNIVRGILSGSSDDITILRLDRSGCAAPVHQLNTAQVKDLASDPVLRHSNALDGLFHHAVVVVEGDTDASFFRAVVDAFTADQAPLDQKDILFVPAGDKLRVARVVSALRAVHIPVGVVFDFDVLNDPRPIQATLEALRAPAEEIKEIERLRGIVDSAVREHGSEKTVGVLMDEIKNIVGDDENRHLSGSQRREMSSVVRRSTAWGEVKDQGLSRVPPGHANDAATEILAQLERHGIHVVPTGEVESFDRGASRATKQQWLVEALERDSQKAVASTSFTTGVLRRTLWS